MNTFVGSTFVQSNRPFGERLKPVHADLYWNDDEELNLYFETEIQPYAEEFEERRQEAVKETMVTAATIIPAAIVLVALATWAAMSFNSTSNVGGFALFNDAANPIVFLCFLVGTGCWYLISRPLKLFRSSVKAEVFPKIFEFFGDRFSYSEKSPISIESLERSRIIPGHDKAELEDYVKGEYEDIDIELVEARLVKISKGKHRNETVKFNGICILLSMPKNFTSNTVVRRDGGKVKNWFKSSFTTLERVELEDPVFEKEFEVLSDDQVEARYLLSSTFMERLLKLQHHYGGTSLEASFYNNKLLLMIPCAHNHFEVASVWEEKNFVEETRTIVQEMRGIFDIIDILKLNERTGL
ncbi:DUF3137 domain-containing protein [Pseudahrensia aquimaris]|uniref:DUF3137 domain-containing protein n=1 Tax=Pseudahrensia aquimaris TaxID=744461 RepID=A0ABW3FIQ9_9HYPH